MRIQKVLKRKIMAFFSEAINLVVNNAVAYRIILNIFGKIEFKRDIGLKVHGLDMYSNTPDRFIASFLWKFSILESYEASLLKQIVKPGMRVVDIGANIGYYTLLMALLTGPKGEITAFEPDPDNYRLLTKNIKCNRIGNITAVKKAVSNRSGSARLFLNRGHRGDHRIFDNKGQRPSLGIETTSIDDYLAGKRVDLIKMDIQGAELLALQGMRKTIRENPGVIIITEFSPYLLERCGACPSDYLDAIETVGLEFELINENTKGLEPISKMELLARCSGTRYENLLLKHPGIR